MNKTFVDFACVPSSARVSELEKLGEGRQAELFAWPKGAVKLFHEPGNSASVQWEATVMHLLWTTGIPMPRFLGMVMIEGRPGIVMERLTGGNQLSLLERKPWSIPTAGKKFARLHAALHLARAPKHLRPLRHSVGEEIERSELIPYTIKKATLTALDRLPDGDAVCHWDFHPGNVIETADGLKVVDWANARRGDAHADIARTVLILKSAALPSKTPFLVRRLTAVARGVFYRHYLDEYRRLRSFEEEILKNWMSVSAASRLSYGIPQERNYLLALLDNN